MVVVYPSNPIPSQHWSLHGSKVRGKQKEMACQVRSAIVVLQKIKRKTKQKTTDMGEKIRLGFNNMIELKNNLPQ
jgi:hypothetical protein